MKKGGVLVYKCRKCGQLDKSLHVPNVLLAITFLTAGHELPQAWGGLGLKMTGIHFCGERSCGISDLIGGE